MNQKLSPLTRYLTLAASLALVAVIFLPLWQIELSAPQYPEGLNLIIYPHKLGGQVDVVNGLNHYIGMRTLHTEDFVEFTILPYIIGTFAVFGLLTFLINRKWFYTVWVGLFLIFAVISMVDFYRWEYNYGHNLDPNAAIQVPGMSYQPPLIGYKQLLNFGAYSIPDIGGWLLIASGFLLFIIVIKESNLLQKFKKPKTTIALLLFLSLSFLSCANNTKAVAIKLNVDNCDFCKMSIADGKYGAEVITEKGRTYKFDDIMCMMNYCRENSNTKISSYYVHDFTQDNILIPAPTAHFISGGTIKSPMRGGVIAFSSEKDAKEFGTKLNAEFITWDAILKK